MLSGSWTLDRMPSRQAARGDRVVSRLRLSCDVLGVSLTAVPFVALTLKAQASALRGPSWCAASTTTNSEIVLGLLTREPQPHRGLTGMLYTYIN